MVRTICEAPIGRLDADRTADAAVARILLQLADGAGFRLDRDYYVRLDTNDYAVDPQVIGRLVR